MKGGQAFYCRSWRSAARDPISAVLSPSSPLDLLLSIQRNRIASDGELEVVVTALHRTATLWRKAATASASRLSDEERNLLLQVLPELAERLATLRGSFGDGCLEPAEVQEAWGPTHSSRTLCACAKFCTSGVDLPHSLLSLAQKLVEELLRDRMRSFSIHIVAHLSWALAHLVGSSPTAAHRMWAQGLSRRPAASTMQFIGHLGDVGETVAHRVDGAWKDMESSELAMVTWALARLLVQDKALYAAGCHAAESRLPVFQVSELSNIAWALATIGVEEPASFFEAFADEVAKRAKSRLAAAPEGGNHDLKELVHIAWAYAALSKMSHPEMYEAIAECVSSVEMLGSSHVEFRLLALLLWTLGKAQHFHARLLAAVRDRLTAEAAACQPLRFSVRDISTCCYGFVAFSVTDKDLCSAIAALVLKATSLGARFVLQDILFFLTCLEHVQTSVDTQLYPVLSHLVASHFAGSSKAHADQDGANGGWFVLMLTALLRHRQHCEIQSLAALEATFAETVYQPLIDAFRDVALLPCDSRSLEVVRSLVAGLKVDHLGSIYSERALLDLGLRCPQEEVEAWSIEARSAIAETFQQDQRAVASQHVIAAWAQFRLEVFTQRELEDVGVLAASGSFVQHYMLANDPWWQEVEELDRIFKPIRAKHGRSGHAERVALLRVLKQAPWACASFCRSSPLVTGIVNLFVTRWPCTSCLAVFCQWRGLLPGVKLSVVFDELGGRQHGPLSTDQPESGIVGTFLPSGRMTYYPSLSHVKRLD